MITPRALSIHIHRRDTAPDREASGKRIRAAGQPHRHHAGNLGANLPAHQPSSHKDQHSTLAQYSCGMSRAMRRAAALLACGFLAAACQTSDKPEPPNQSSVYFPAAVAQYGFALSQTDRDHLAELYALRQIDPCGFVDRKSLGARGHDDFTYTYTAVHEIGDDGVPPLFPLGGDGCTVAIPGTKTGLSLRIIPGEPHGTDIQFSPDSAHPDISKRDTPMCEFRASIPLAAVAGAPAAMGNPVLEISPISVADGRWEFDDTSLCGLAEAIATGISTRIQEHGIPARSDTSSSAAMFLTKDPCEAANDLHAVGFDWHAPNPEAQWPTTWRHPSVCNLRLQPGSNNPTPVTAVVRYGLAAWSDSVLQSSSGRPPIRSELDGVTLYDFSAPDAPDCFVVAKTNLHVEPVNVGSGGTELIPPTPVVTVRLNSSEGTACAATATQAALAAAKRAT